MQKAKEKRKESPYRDKRLRAIYFTPLILAVLVVGIPSLLGEWRIDYLLSDRFIYPIAYFLNNTDLQWLWFVGLIVIWLSILTVKTRIIFVVIAFLVSVIISAVCLVLAMVTSGIWITNVKIITIEEHTYHLSHVFTNGFADDEELFDPIYHTIVFRCDSYSLVCETQSSYMPRVRTEWNGHLNGSFDLVTQNNQLLFVYRFHERFIHRYGEMETIAIIEENLLDLTMP